MKRALWVLIILMGAAAVMLALGVRLDMDPAEVEAKYATGHSQFIQVDDLRVHYRDQGNGFPLVLVHGTASSLHTWEGWVKVLEHHFRVISLDLPAYGLTGPSQAGDYSVQAYCDFLDAFLDKLEIKECDLAGNSLGGRIAWGYAWRHPKRIRKLILVDSAGFPMKKMPRAIKLARMPVVKNIARWVTPRAIVERSVKSAYGDPSRVTDDVVDRYHAMLLRKGNREALGRRAMTNFFDQTGKLKLIKQPTLILWGAKDTWIPPEDAAKFAQELPNAEVIIYPDAGHIPMEEIPQRSAADALTFLQR